jgi:hypothetical protein
MGILLPVLILLHRGVAIINSKDVVILRTRMEEVEIRKRKGRRDRMVGV